MGSRDPFAALHALSSHLVPTYEAGGTSVRQGGGACGSSRLHHSDISVPPPYECIYAILHMHMICIYIGRTHLPLIQRLREHITTANAQSEDCHLHQLLRSTNIEDWYIVPLELVWGRLRAAIAERYWWDKYRR